jgi:hypothetical protein
MAQEEQEGLLGFNWENDGDDFFGIEQTTTATPSKKEKEKKVEIEEEEGNPTPPTSTEPEEEEEDDFFETSEEEEEEGDEGKPNPPASTSIYSDVYKDLKEQGIFKHIEVEEGEELDADKFFELQQEEYEAEVNARLTNWATKELDEDAKAFIKFKRDGGNTEDFFSIYSKSTDLPTGDISEESHQDRVIRYQLKQEGWDADEIEDRLRYLTESGRKEKVAKKYNAKIKEQSEAQKAEVLKQANKQKELIQAQEQEFKDNIKSVLDTTKDVKGIKISDKDKIQLYNFLTKKAHKISDTKSITGFQKKLGEAFQDTNKMILLAKLISSDFDMKDFEKATVTKKTQQIKSNLEQRKGLRPTNSGSSLEGKGLADLFN